MGQQVNPTDSQNDYQVPEHLRSYELLEQHFRAQLEGLSTTQKGDRFVHFTQRLVPQTELGIGYQLPVLREKKSYDEGVDLTAAAKDGQSTLFIQARLWVDRVEAIDSVVSKFENFLKTNEAKESVQRDLFTKEDGRASFLLATLSPLQNLIRLYESRDFSSKEFYKRLKSEGRIHFIDGHQVLPILRAAYGKISQLPTTVTLHLETDFIQKENVFISVLSNAEVQALYMAHGDALFFENIRDFLGVSQERSGRTTPNEEITRTITKDPDKMLERNNGIVFRAERVKPSSSGRELVLNKGSIVNGCQTTMCLVANPTTASYVLVKVVQTADSWDVAKAANFQNRVFDIDLELARNLRPQLAKRAALVSGTQLEAGQASAFQILDAIYNRKVAYSETRLLYIALFSASPNTIFTANYTELK